MNNCYVPLHNHSFYSLLDGLPSPRRIAERAREINAPALALTDHGSIFGIVEHQKACEKVGIKPIGGIELYMCLDDPTIKTNQNNKRHHLTILAKNAEGVKTLMALVSATNRPDWFYRKPRIDLKHLAEFAADGNLICLSGCLASELSHALFTDEKVEIRGKFYDGVGAACTYSDEIARIEEAKQLLRSDWQDNAAQVIRKYQEAFGPENYYLEIQEEGMVSQKIVVECLRQLAKDLKIKSVATLDSHYACKEDYDDHIILLCSQLHTTMEEQERMRSQGGDTMAFFYLDQFYIFDGDEMAEHYTPEEMEMSLEIADRIDGIKLGRNPCLPKYTNETIEKTKIDSITFLKNTCIAEAKTKLAHLTDEQKRVYWDRLEHELSVIREAGLADYFLIVWDACAFISEHNAPKQCRGSGAGSLVNYLLGVSNLDPIEYGLYFERFYNASRNIPPHFDLAKLSFMDWYVENFSSFATRSIIKARRDVAIRCKFRVKDKKMLAAEAKWIDKNSPKMWLFLNECLIKYEENTTNSHILYSMGVVEQLDETKHCDTHDGHISLPDIDLDVGVKFRNKVIDYLREKWGDDHVAQMITFGRLQGKAALKEVFRARQKDVIHLMKVKALKEGKDPEAIGMAPFEVCNEITKHIPDEAMISDELQEIRDAENNPDYGILEWAVHHIEEVGNAYEWYKPLFDQAMRIEGTKKSQSKHAAGVVISDVPIETLVPLAYDAKNKSRVVGVEMSNAEALGAVKFDFLGVTALDKLWFGQALINELHQEADLDETFVETENGN